MTQRQNKMPTVKGLEANATDAYCNLPTGLTYDTVNLAKNFHAKGMLNIRVKVGNKTIQTFKDGVELENWNKRYNRHTDEANGNTLVHFVRPELHDFVERRLTAIGTADVGEFRIVFNMASTLYQLDGTTPLAVDPTMTVTALRSARQPLGIFTRIEAKQEDFSTTGEQIWDDLKWRGRLAGMHLVGGTISEWTFKLGDNEFHNTTATVNEVFALCGHFPRQAVSDWQHLDFISEGETDHALVDIYTDKRLEFTNGASGNIRMLVETFDTMDAA